MIMPINKTFKGDLCMNLIFFAYCVLIFDFSAIQYFSFIFVIITFFDATGVDVFYEAVAVNNRRVPSFLYVLADLINRTYIAHLYLPL